MQWSFQWWGHEEKEIKPVEAKIFQVKKGNVMKVFQKGEY